MADCRSIFICVSLCTGQWLSQPATAAGSLLTIYQAMPSGYQTFSIIKNCFWMSLVPQSLAIGGTKTAWPDKTASPIAMVDTGGGPVFLSDPNGYVYLTHWPEQVPLPAWASSSDSCQSVRDDLGIVLGDQNGSFSYGIQAGELPASAQGLTLVMCKKCYYMMENQGMNIRGLSALFNFILIDYASMKVGFKSKKAVPISS